MTKFQSMKDRTPIVVVDPGSGSVVARFDTMSAAADAYGVTLETVYNTARMRKVTKAGVVFRYANEYVDLGPFGEGDGRRVDVIAKGYAKSYGSLREAARGEGEPLGYLRMCADRYIKTYYDARVVYA